jgi:mono/diheme cytochrome c family protein
MGRRLVHLLAALLLISAALWLTSTILLAQKRIVHVAAQRIEPPDGVAVYRAYCTSCHGVDLHGNGPASPLVGQHVEDLTRIAIRDGSFDLFHVMAHVRGSYGTDAMPDWQAVIRDAYGHSGREELVIRNLALYLG